MSNLRQNKFERYVKFMAEHDIALIQRRVAWSCGCSIDIVAPQKDRPGLTMGTGYVVNPCAQHPKGWKELPEADD